MNTQKTASSFLKTRSGSDHVTAEILQANSRVLELDRIVLCYYHMKKMLNVVIIT